MPIPRIEHLGDLRDRTGGRGSRLWSEWCFVKACLRRFRWRLVTLVVLLLTGGVLFMVLEPEAEHSFPEAVYYTYSLIFGEPPEAFPRHSAVLQVLFFVVPVLGLTVIIEGIVELALMLRDRRRFERSWCVMLAASYKDHVVLVGLGRLGIRTYQILRRLGEAVVVIEREPTNEFLEIVRRDGAPLLIGDARREAILGDANVAAARSIVLATDDDMANLEAALDARRLNPEIRVVLRMFDQNMADKIQGGFDIHLAMSTSALSAPTFATCALAPATESSFIVGDQLVAMQRWLVRQDGLLCDATIGEVMRRHGVTVVEHVRAGTRRVCPPPETNLEAGDGLLLQGPLPTLERLRETTFVKAVQARG